MDTEQFFTNPTIIPAVPELKLLPRKDLDKAKAVPFLDKYTIKIGPLGAAVYDGKKIIASVGIMNSLIVDPDYRGKGIATNMIFQWLVANPGFLAMGVPARTENGKKAYAKAWEMYQAYLEGLKK